MKSARIMFFYAGFLMACGVAAYFMAPPNAKAGTALYASGAAALGMITCGALASMFPRNRTAGMIGIHVGLILPILFGITFAVFGFRRFTAAQPVIYLATIFTIMALGSLVAFIAILMTRPPKEKRGI